MVVSVVFWKRRIPICFFFKKEADFFKISPSFFMSYTGAPKNSKRETWFFCVTKGKMQKAIDARLQGGGSDWGCFGVFNIQELDVGRLQLLYRPPKKHGSKKGMFSPRWLRYLGKIPRLRPPKESNRNVVQDFGCRYGASESAASSNIHVLQDW